MRTCFLEPKSDTSPHTTPGRAMAQSRLPFPSYVPESSEFRTGRRLRSSGPPHEPDEGEEEGVDVGHEQEERLFGPPYDYEKLRRRVATELEGEMEKQRRNVELIDSMIPESVKPEKTQELSFPFLVVGLSFLFLVLVGLAAYVSRPVPDPKAYDDWLWKNLTANMRVMRSEFPSQANSTWLHFASGIRKVLTDEPTEPSVFLLVHRGGNDATCACLARKIARVAHGLLDAPTPGPLVVEGSALGEYVDGLLVTAYKPLVESHRTLVVEDLQSVPADVARGLHIFCDTVTPLVRKAVYVFTLAVGGGGEEAHVSETAQKGLYTAWGRLDRDVLAPLVARVMGGFVLAVEPEEGVADVC